jgi:hypothetical protein
MLCTRASLGFKLTARYQNPVGNSGDVALSSNVGVSITYLTEPVKQQFVRVEFHSQFIRVEFHSPSTIGFAFC